MGVGMPHALYLDEFASHVWHAFGSPPYLVGSALLEKAGWRDVDVRMILADDEWDRLGFGDPDRTHHNGQWVALCLAFSALGKAITGLPIDFQIQRSSHANKAYGDQPRSALGLVSLRFAKEQKDHAAALAQPATREGER
jgi:hypothetical protein